MAKKFDKVKSSASEVAKKEAVKSSVPTSSINVLLENLILDPKNGEDIEHTEELEYSIGRFGFRGNIEVTDFGCKDGEYLIISGHRRFVALKNLGYDTAPCLVYHFEKEEDILDYNQCMNNASRDSAKDPMMWLKRYPNNREVLLKQNPKMSEAELTEEIAKRFGQSKQQIERYKALTKVIPTALELANEGKVGIFSLVPLAPLTEEQQNEVFGILMDALEEMRESGEEENLTRPMVNNIVKAYKSGNVKTWEEFRGQQSESVDSANGDFDGMNKPVDEEKEAVDGDTAEEAEVESGSGASGASGTDEDDFRDTSDDGEAKEVKQGRNIMNLVTKLDTAMQESYVYSDDESRIVAISSMGKLIETLIGEMNNMAIDCTEGGWDAFMLARKGIKDGLDSTAN